MNNSHLEILNKIKQMSTNELVDALRCGILSKEQLLEVGFSNESIEEFERLLAEEDFKEWNGALTIDSVEGYVGYMRRFPHGAYSQECAAFLEEKECQMWQDIKLYPTEFSIKRYLNLFPTGLHSVECEVLLEDKLWLETLQKSTLEAYEYYRLKCPERHIEEVSFAIDELTDEQDWAQTIQHITLDSLQYYILNHPQGKYLIEAKAIINTIEHKEDILKELLENPNLMSVRQIQDYVRYGVMTTEELAKVFSVQKLDSILNYASTVEMPLPNESDVVGVDRTEVYFWGTPQSGKTSVIGSILAGALKRNILTLWESQGGNYMLKLTELFSKKETQAFPERTNPECTYEMQCALDDCEGERHEISLIDFSGELVVSMYESQAGLPVSHEYVLNALKMYVLNQTNRKIHFFVVEYGKHFEEWHGIRMDNYLEISANYLMRDETFRKMTNAVYILVTKADNMQCDEKDRTQFAENYIREYYPSFYNSLELACQQSNIGDFAVLDFSVGEVFAQQLCVPESLKVNEIIDSLIINTPIEKKKWWKF